MIKWIKDNMPVITTRKKMYEATQWWHACCYSTDYCLYALRELRKNTWDKKRVDDLIEYLEFIEKELAK